MKMWRPFNISMFHALLRDYLVVFIEEPGHTAANSGERVVVLPTVLRADVRKQVLFFSVPLLHQLIDVRNLPRVALYVHVEDLSPYIGKPPH